MSQNLDYMVKAASSRWLSRFSINCTHLLICEMPLLSPLGCFTSERFFSLLEVMTEFEFFSIGLRTSRWEEDIWWPLPDGTSCTLTPTSWFSLPIVSTFAYLEFALPRGIRDICDITDLSYITLLQLISIAIPIKNTQIYSLLWLTIIITKPYMCC